MKKIVKLKLISLILSLLIFGCGQVPIKPPQMEKRYADKDLDPIEEALDLNLMDGNIKPLISGTNKIVIKVPKSDKVVEFNLDVPSLTTKFAGGSLKASLNNVAFKSFTARWDGDRKAVRIRSDLFDKKDGIVGELNLGGLRVDLIVGVRNAHIDILLFPKAIDGEIAFDNPKVELDFDLENIEDPKSKQALVADIQKALDSESNRINESFRKHENDLIDIVKSNFEKGVRFKDIIIENGSATVKVEFPGAPAFPRWDVNKDGTTDIFDLVAIGIHFGEKPLLFSDADVNSDGEVDIFDLVIVAQHFGESSAKLSPQRTVELQNLLSLVKDPKAKEFILSFTSSQNRIKSALFQNYPNPFNPETWIPYQLKNGSNATVRIYDSAGRLVRKIDLGYKEAGYYLSQQEAAYWDGRNESGEKVPSGLYFYQLQTADFSSVRKLTVIK